MAQFSLLHLCQSALAAATTTTSTALLLSTPNPSYFTAYRQMRSLPASNTPSDSSISMIVGVTGILAHVA